MRGRGCEVQTLLGVGDTGSIAASPRYASVMTGAAVGLLAYVLQAPLWASILLGAGGAITTKYVIDQSAGGPAPSPSTTV